MSKLEGRVSVGTRLQGVAVSFVIRHSCFVITGSPREQARVWRARLNLALSHLCGLHPLPI